MLKIGITGSIASGKSTVSRYFSKKGYPTYIADLAVSELYRDQKVIKKLKKTFKIRGSLNLKSKIKKSLQEDKKNLIKLEKIIHPEVRKKMKLFFKKKKKSKIIVCEIPLLIEKKLMKYFDAILLVGANRKNRLKRYLKKGGKRKIFDILDKKQMKQSKKVKYCDHVIHNNKSLDSLKNNISNIIQRYE
ncbi:MAG: dephospho-CoA kinase [Pelagibacteraceae bacterium TMED287]|nr:MAG: dephospho-CoA kinase [Pelagibacteraceae bacterium TMED287]|tara:strand:+ start:293 stop:859 length:567 start_codon:yes stop_codon:yes gene_type:complete